jgi:hypothetical protein
MIMKRGKLKYSEKTCPSATLATINLTWPGVVCTRADSVVDLQSARK